MTLEDIGEGRDALICVTDLTTCCRPPYSGVARGNWYFPNGTRVPSSSKQWDFHRTRNQMVVLLNRRRGGVEGMYHCEIPDAMNVTQTIYIGVYSANTGVWCMVICLNAVLELNCQRADSSHLCFYFGRGNQELIHYHKEAAYISQ